MKFIDKKTIEINRELSDLDKFAIEFLKILQRYSSYVIVSGYVSILLGRARASEDIDVLIPKIDFLTFLKIYNELKTNDFYCMNAEEDSDVYEYLEDDLAIRFAKKDTIIPNIEMKWIKRRVDEISLNNSIEVKLQKEKIRISPLELQIVFKEKILKSPKDLEDAEHIRDVAREYLDKKLIEQYEEMLHGLY